MIYRLIGMVKLFRAQRRSRFASIFLDGVGILVLLPAIFILFMILDIDAGGRNMTGAAAFAIYSVMTLGIVPILTILTICMFTLSIRLIKRTWKRQIFS